jgi:hypothetical protein
VPQIAQYEAPQGLGLKPTNLGTDATAASARRLQADYTEAAAATEKLGSQIGSDIELGGKIALEHMDAQQISHGAVGYAGLTSDIMKQWDDTVKSADPNDPTVAAKFRAEVLEPRLQEFKDKGFYTEGGQKWAEAHIEQLRTHMLHKTDADMSTLGGQSALVNVKQTTNAMASAASRDPSSLDFMLKTYESAIGTSIDANPNLTGTAAAKVKTELLQAGKEAIVKAAVFGMIEKNPSTDLDAVEKKYGEFVTGPEMRTFAKQAAVQQRVDNLRIKQTEIAQKQLDVAAVHQAANKVLTDNVSVDPVTNRPVINPKLFRDAIEVAKMPNAPDGLARTLLDWGESQMNKEAKVYSDPGTRADLVARMGASDRPTTEIDILRAEADGKLAHPDANQLRTLQQAILKRPEGESIKANRDGFFKNYAPSIDGGIEFGMHSALGSQKVYEAQMDARRQEEALRAAGRDPGLVYDPRAPEFFGRPENIARYHVSLTDAMKYEASVKNEKTGTAPANPSPSGATYPAPAALPTPGKQSGPPPRPAALGGVASLQWNFDLQQWRDRTSGQLYDRAGNAIKTPVLNFKDRFTGGQ